jgi:hypothetical protein
VQRFVRVIVVLSGISFVVVGIWAFVDPQSFYDLLAEFPSYNRHFIHDIGAFQIGIGVTLLMTLRWADAVLVALAGAAIGSLFHFVAHLEDTDIGGRSTDPALVGALALVLVAAAIARALTLQRQERAAPAVDDASSTSDAPTMREGE